VQNKPTPTTKQTLKNDPKAKTNPNHNQKTVHTKHPTPTKEPQTKIDKTTFIQETKNDKHHKINKQLTQKNIRDWKEGYV